MGKGKGGDNGVAMGGELCCEEEEKLKEKEERKKF